MENNTNKTTTTSPIKLRSLLFPGLLANIAYHIKHDGNNLSLIPHDPLRTLTVSLNNKESQVSVMSLGVDGGDDTSKANVNVKALLAAKKYIDDIDKGNKETINEEEIAPVQETAQEPEPEKKKKTIKDRLKRLKGFFAKQGGKKRTHKNKRKSMRKKSMKKKPGKTMKKGNKYPGYKKNGGKRKNNRITKKRRKKGGNGGNEGNEGKGNEEKSWRCRIGDTLENCKNIAEDAILSAAEPLIRYVGYVPSDFSTNRYQKRINYEIELQNKILAKAAEYLKEHGEEAKEEDFYKYLMELAEEKEELIQKLINKRDRK